MTLPVKRHINNIVRSHIKDEFTYDRLNSIFLSNMLPPNATDAMGVRWNDNISGNYMDVKNLPSWGLTTDDFITINKETFLDFTPGTDEFAIRMFYKHTSGNSQALLGQDDEGTNQLFNFGINSSGFYGAGIEANDYDTIATAVTPSTTLYDKIWYIVKGNDYFIYINGSLVLTGTFTSFTLVNTEWFIGKHLLSLFLNGNVLPFQIFKNDDCKNKIVNNLSTLDANPQYSVEDICNLLEIEARNLPSGHALKGDGESGLVAKYDQNWYNEAWGIGDNIAINGDCEDGFTGGLANGWTKQGVVTTKEEEVIVFNGDRSQKATFTTALSNDIVGFSSNSPEIGTYLMRVAVKTNKLNITIRMRCGGVFGTNYDIIDSLDWKIYYIITECNSLSDLSLFIRSGFGGDAICYIDYGGIFRIHSASINGSTKVYGDTGYPSPLENGHNLTTINGSINQLSEVYKDSGVGYDFLGNAIQYPRDKGLSLLTGIGANNQYLIKENVTIPAKMTLLFVYLTELEDSFIEFGTTDTKGITSTDNKVILNRASAHEDVSITIEQKVMSITISNTDKELITTSLSGIVDDLTFNNNYVAGTDDLIVPNSASSGGANIVNLIAFGFVPDQVLSESLSQVLLTRLTIV